MAVNHKTLSDYEVVTAAWAQSHLMDQVIVKADTLGELNGLPGNVVAGYVGGEFYIRNSAGEFKRGGGAAEVSETAPTNPGVGQLWVKPSEIFPLPVRAALHTGVGTVTATAWAQVPGSTTVNFVNNTGKAVMCQVQYAGWFSITASTTASIRSRLVWTGALTGNSFDHTGGWGAGSLYLGVNGSGNSYESMSTAFTLALPNGTTTFAAHGYKEGTTTVSNMNYLNIGITPLAWADQYADGVN